LRFLRLQKAILIKIMFFNKSKTLKMNGQNKSSPLHPAAIPGTIIVFGAVGYLLKHCASSDQFRTLGNRIVDIVRDNLAGRALEFVVEFVVLGSVGYAITSSTNPLGWFLTIILPILGISGIIFILDMIYAEAEKKARLEAENRRRAEESCNIF